MSCKKCYAKLIKGYTMSGLEKKFPSYFNNFELPEGAEEQEIKVFRACKTGKVDSESFIPSFEENNYRYSDEDDKADPGLYSLSSYEKPSDIKRFATMINSFKIPFKIAVGVTSPDCGPSQRTKKRKPKSKNSHVDWWLYEGAKPYIHFTLIDDFEQYHKEYKERSQP